jgi:hypothetical protein
MDRHLVNAVAEQIDRRRFLRRTAAGLAAALLGLFGIAAPAAALVTYKCCVVCFYPSGTVTGSCTGSPRRWCWNCHHSDGFDYKCCETYAAGYSCDGSCAGVLYSTVRKLGTAPEPATEFGQIGAGTSAQTVAPRPGTGSMPGTGS